MPAAAPRRRVSLDQPLRRMVMAFAAEVARSQLGELERNAAEGLLAHFVRAAERLEARAARRGQLAIEVGPRVFPTAPPLRRRRRRRAETAEGRK